VSQLKTSKKSNVTVHGCRFTVNRERLQIYSGHAPNIFIAYSLYYILFI